MNILNKIKRFYYKYKNSDPCYKCKLYLKEGCSHVDGMLCDFPNCNMLHDYLGHEWIACCECAFIDECSSNQFGLGCYNGLNKYKYEKTCN